MRAVIGLCIAGFAAFTPLSCAHRGHASISREAAADGLLVADSLEAASYDDLFVEKHGALIKELDREEREERAVALLIEARSLVSAAEEMYLEGKVLLAIRLLERAEDILRRDN